MRADYLGADLTYSEQLLVIQVRRLMQSVDNYLCI